MKYTSTYIDYPRSDSVPLILNDLHDLRNILLAGIMVRSFHHHAHDRLRAGLAHQNTAGVAQCFCNCLDCNLHRLVVLCSLFISHTDVLKNLRVDLQRLSQHDLHHLEAGQDTVTGACVFGENDVTALFAADATAVLCHILVDVLVAYA